MGSLAKKWMWPGFRAKVYPGAAFGWAAPVGARDDGFVAKAGKVILITDRGQPVARLVPMTRNENARNKLIDDGQSRIDLRAAAELDHNNYYRLELGLCGG